MNFSYIKIKLCVTFAMFIKLFIKEFICNFFMNSPILGPTSLVMRSNDLKMFNCLVTNAEAITQ